MADTDVKTVRLGTRDVKFPSPELQPMESCNHLLGNREALLKELDEKGYLLIRDFHDRQEVLEARTHVLHVIRNLGDHKLDHARPVEDGVLDKRCGRGCIPEFQGKNDITHSEAVNKVLEGPRPYSFFETLLGKPARSFDYKWLRAVHRQVFTGAHVDNVYMSRGTTNLYTMWTPFGDCSPEIGCLAMCEGSNKLQSFKKLHETYSEVDIEAVNLHGTGWFTHDPFEITERFGGQWKTTSFNAGDALIFTMKTVHMSTANLTDLVRISCDTRWQPASEPADHRYVGEFVDQSLKFGLHADGTTKPTKSITMEELKTKWGFQ